MAHKVNASTWRVLGNGNDPAKLSNNIREEVDQNGKIFYGM